ncbi:MAG: N,N'-diacetyllegionaminic acid synthase [Syntrophorhabdus sp. PtaB.Bin027]|nr:MAG: N,N'-diacetyllegionaminic acid synthase [Syntrophorhabdus sp. PtaB.Bin027]
MNHNGRINLAKELIDVAAEAGADAVKFQTFRAENVVTCHAEKAEYQKSSTSANESQYEMIKNLELPDESFRDLSDYAKKRGIIFLSTPFDEESADLLDQIGVPAYKIPSGEITNYPLLKKIAKKRKPVILSTGMSTLGEVEEAFNYLKKNGARYIVLLHCTTSYPAPLHSANLRAMKTLQCAFCVPVGFSDHTEGITISIAAVAMGATVLEKHFTLDRTLPGPDHLASLEPGELKAMVQAIRDVECAQGDGIKKPNEVEIQIREIARKSIVAKRSIKKNEIITSDMLTVKRPGTGIKPNYLHFFIGKKINCDLEKDNFVLFDMVNEE